MDDTLSIDDQLDAWLAQALEELGDEPTDLDHAGRLLAAMRGIDRRIAEVDAYVAKRIADLREFQGDTRDPLLARREHLDRLIGGWALAEWERTGRKTWKVPEGEIKVRPNRPQMKVDARSEVTDAVLDVLGVQFPRAVKTERSILVSAIKSDDVWSVETGDVIEDYPAEAVPDGYEPREVWIMSADIDFSRVLEGVVAMAPLPGRAGQRASAKPQVRS